MKRPLFIGSEIYRGSSYGSWHPLRVPRVSTVIDLSRAMGWLPNEAYVPSPRAKPNALTIWHTPDYLSALHRAEALQHVSDDVRARHGLGTSNNPVFPEMYRRPATAAGGSLLAGELLRDGGIVYHPAGGTHHAMPDRAGGFCYLNDPVLAILSLRRNGATRIAYVDIDAHHPDGVEVAFGDDQDVLMISVHEEGLWPRTGELGATDTLVNLPVPRNLNDDEMALIRDQVILPRVQAFRPDAIVIQCGADGVEEDPQAHLSLSNNAHWAIVRDLIGLAPRLLVLGGGGYNPWSVGRLWTGVWATLNGYDIPDRVTPEGEDVLRGLRFDGNRRGKNPPEHWFTSLQDTPRNGPIREEVRHRLAQL
ncbi:acetoin utilization protein AcuC [uncultured Tateyamaria sp.]|uniref:acetoin utilization protein AcuC n=1 Tax=uncultured Tateyamaria sp. TaxID=455651 RepID=UPI002637183A|nr:acetoin utilization protein AcuC [uncultured Tateyamaria sp.]